VLGHEAAALREELSRKADEVDLQILDLSLVFGEHSQVPPTATWKRQFKLPWREAGSPNHYDDVVHSD
jgi:hypothetical protein